MAPVTPTRSAKPPAPLRRDVPHGIGSPHDWIASGADPSLAQTRDGQRTATPPGPSPMSPSRTPANFALPSHTRIPGRTPYNPPPMGANNRSPHGDEQTSSSARDSTSEDLSQGSESTASSDDAFPVVTQRPFGFGAFGIGGRGIGVPPFLLRATPPGSFHSLRPPASRTGLQRPPSSDSGRSDRTTSSARAEHDALWGKVLSQRRQVVELREELKVKRKEVQTLRRKKDEKDNAFMQFLRPHLLARRSVTTIDTEVLPQKFGELQRIRNEYYLVEDAYEALEDKLIHEETELETLEGDLYRVITNDDNEIDDKSDGDLTPDEQDHEDDRVSRTSLLGIRGERDEDVHPLYQELLEAAGEFNLAKEHHDELRHHRDKILHGLVMDLYRDRARVNQGASMSEEDLKSLKSSLSHFPATPAQFRAKYGIPIDLEDLEFLHKYEQNQELAGKAVEESRDTVDRLLALCEEKDVMRKNAPYHELYTIRSASRSAPIPLDGNTTIAIDEQPRGPGALAHPRFPILLSNPSHVLDLLEPKAGLEHLQRYPNDDPAAARRRAELMKELGINNLIKKGADSKPDYINRWLIHRLRTCPMEAELIFSISEGMFRIANIRRWQEDVLYHWRKDDAANLSPQGFAGPMTARDELEVDDESEWAVNVNSIVGGSERARSEDGGERRHHQRRRTGSRSAMSAKG
ncbi:hypothetical protein OQA88_4932 [Cercophora sp. LCS_1]